MLTKKCVPMGKSYTLLKSSHKNHVENNVDVKTSTINFLKQFARAYSYDKRLSCGLGSFVAN